MNRMSANVLLFAAGLLLLIPAAGQTQQEGPPPIEQQLVREGDFAVKLVSALGIETTQDEIEAESRLGAAGVTPRNGWIADYPVTPDIIGELAKSVGSAADSGKLAFGRDEALKRLNDVAVSFGLAIRPYTGGQAYGPESSGSQNYPNPQDINSYYYDEGPPVVTYYYPPPDFYYLYAWVPFPFWCSGFWFPGFFILQDFHRTIIVSGRVVFVSNHFNDVRRHRVFRIDPVARYSGRTFAGIGVKGTKGFISTGVPHSATRIFHGPHERMPPGIRAVTPPQGGAAGPPAGAVRPAAPHTGPSPGHVERRMMNQPAREGKTPAPRMHEGESVRAPAHEGRMEGEHPGEGRGSGVPSREGETSHPSVGGGMMR
ncbi:MAG TPA: hypothetical protein VLZ07_09185 [Syntrophales bacterium]|nr:hypothetical protein [Syntrophales bacterium]